MFFASDNWAGAHPKIAASLSSHAAGFAPAYGSERTRSMPCRTSSTRSSSARSRSSSWPPARPPIRSRPGLGKPPGGIAFCHREAHVIEDECGAPEYFTGGARLCPVDGAAGADRSRRARTGHRRASSRDFVHAGQPMAVTITQATEVGTVYAPGRDRGDLGDREAARPAAAHGRRALCQCAGRARSDAGGDDLEARRRHPLLRRHQERLLVRRGGRPVRPRNAPRIAPSAQARRASSSPNRASSRRSSRPISKTDSGWRRRATPTPWRRGWPHISRASSRVRLAWEPQANEVFAIMTGQRPKGCRTAGAAFYDWHSSARLRGEIAADEGSAASSPALRRPSRRSIGLAT